MTTPRLAAGRLRHRVTILAPVVERSTVTGQAITTPTTETTVWAEVALTAGQENTPNHRQIATSAGTVTMRPRPITTRHQLAWKGRRYGISAITYPDGPTGPTMALAVATIDEV
jgi:head-tail adaptor